MNRKIECINDSVCRFKAISTTAPPTSNSAASVAPPLIHQTEAAECGLASSAMVAYGKHLPLQADILLENRIFLHVPLDRLRAATGRTLG